MLRLVLSLAITCFISGLLLSYTNNLTLPERARQQKLEKLQVVANVLPEAEEIEEREIGGVTFYLGKKDGEITGVSFLQEEKGYSGKVSVMLGMDRNGRTTGIEIVSHKETPGLGSKIEDEPFKAQFKGIDLSVSVKKDGDKIDAITGATISSRAICQAVNNGIELFKEVKEEIWKK